MASLFDSRPTASPTPPQFPPSRPVDNASSFADVSPRAYSPPIKTTTNTSALPPAPHSADSTPGLEIPGSFPREPVTAASGQVQRQNVAEPSPEQANPPTAIPRHLCTSFFSWMLIRPNRDLKRAERHRCRLRRKKAPNRGSTMTALARYLGPSAKPLSQSCPTSARNRQANLPRQGHLPCRCLRRRGGAFSHTSTTMA
jgi:hypothetical protein